MPPTLPSVVTGLPTWTRALGLGLGRVMLDWQVGPRNALPLLTQLQFSLPATPLTVVTLQVPVCGWVLSRRRPPEQPEVEVE